MLVVARRLVGLRTHPSPGPELGRLVGQLETIEALMSEAAHDTPYEKLALTTPRLSEGDEWLAHLVGPAALNNVPIGPVLNYGPYGSSHAGARARACVGHQHFERHHGGVRQPDARLDQSQVRPLQAELAS